MQAPIPTATVLSIKAPQAVIDQMEFYLLNYLKPAHAEQNEATAHGREVFNRIGCATCHFANLAIHRGRRVADVEKVYDPVARCRNQE